MIFEKLRAVAIAALARRRLVAFGDPAQALLGLGHPSVNGNSIRSLHAVCVNLLFTRYVVISGINPACGTYSIY